MRVQDLCSSVILFLFQFLHTFFVRWSMFGINHCHTADVEVTVLMFIESQWNCQSVPPLRPVLRVVPSISSQFLRLQRHRFLSLFRTSLWLLSTFPAMRCSLQISKGSKTALLSFLQVLPRIFFFLAQHYHRYPFWLTERWSFCGVLSCALLSSYRWRFTTSRAFNDMTVLVHPPRKVKQKVP